MVDVPRHLEPSDRERLHTFLARMTPGGAGGQSRAVGPIRSRVQSRATVAGSGEEDTLDATDSMIDQFNVTGTGTSTFQLTYDPIDLSWNVDLEGEQLKNGTDYSVSGQTLTILDAASLFKGVAAQAPPWVLQVQYDYLAGVPVAPALAAGVPPIVATASAAGGLVSSQLITFGSYTPGDRIILGAVLQELTTPVIGAGWTYHGAITYEETGLPGDKDFLLHLWDRVSDGVDPDVTLASDGSEYITAAYIVLGDVTDLTLVATGSSPAWPTYTTPDIDPAGGLAVYFVGQSYGTVTGTGTATIHQSGGTVQQTVLVATDEAGGPQGFSSTQTTGWGSQVLRVSG